MFHVFSFLYLPKKVTRVPWPFSAINSGILESVGKTVSRVPLSVSLRIGPFTPLCIVIKPSPFCQDSKINPAGFLVAEAIFIPTPILLPLSTFSLSLSAQRASFSIVSFDIPDPSPITHIFKPYSEESKSSFVVTRIVFAPASISFVMASIICCPPTQESAKILKSSSTVSSLEDIEYPAVPCVLVKFIFIIISF